MSEELKPCPFCGSHFVAQGASRDRISVWCKCGARGPEVPFPEINPDPSVAIRECIRLWNHRSGPSQARLSEAVKVLEWYGEQARLCRLVHSEGDAGRHALSEDGGKKAKAFLATLGEENESSMLKL